MKSFFLFLVVMFLHEAYAQVPYNGSCDNFCTANLAANPSNYLGIWYLQQSVDAFSGTIKCAYLNGSAVVNNTLIATLNYISLTDHKQKSDPFNIAFLPNGDVETNFSLVNLPFQYKIISTNSDYFALFVCAECGFFSKDGSGIYGAIYTRLHQSPCATTDIATLDLSNCGIPKEALITQDQTNCALC